MRSRERPSSRSQNDAGAELGLEPMPPTPCLRVFSKLFCGVVVVATVIWVGVLSRGGCHWYTNLCIGERSRRERAFWEPEQGKSPSVAYGSLPHSLLPPQARMPWITIYCALPAGLHSGRTKGQGSGASPGPTCDRNGPSLPSTDLQLSFSQFSNREGRSCP